MEPKRRVGPEATDFVDSQFATGRSQFGGYERSVVFQAAVTSTSQRAKCPAGLPGHRNPMRPRWPRSTQASCAGAPKMRKIEQRIRKLLHAPEPVKSKGEHAVHAARANIPKGFAAPCGVSSRAYLSPGFCGGRVSCLTGALFSRGRRIMRSPWGDSSEKNCRECGLSFISKPPSGPPRKAFRRRNLFIHSASRTSGPSGSTRVSSFRSG